METELAAFAAAAVADRDPGRLDRFPVDVVLRSSLIRREFRSAVPLMANWLSYLASRKE
jgi:hypothetical protein